ncbi:MAG: sortase [Acidimicrobiales bacterium]
MSARTTTIIGGIGRTLITLGCLTLAFAGFQLWGTGIAEDRAQSSLEEDFVERQTAFSEFAENNGIEVGEVGADGGAAIVDEEADPETLPETERDPEVAEAPPVPAASVPRELLPSQGDALGVIRIPKIGVDKVVIAGTSRSDLRKGPGHYGTTPLPGQAGNAAIAGHRTTYGAPFGDLDGLEPGDRIVVETFQGLFNYEVLPQVTAEGMSGHAIISPYDVEVLNDYGDNRLTLTACHPKYSARQRIVVQAQLVNPPAATIGLAGLEDVTEEELSDRALAYEATGIDPGPGDGSTEFDPTIAAELDEGNLVGTSSEALDESLGWHFEELTPFLLWSLLTGLATGAALFAATRWKRWPSYAMASPVVLTLLFFSFTHLDRMMPAF